MLSGCGVAVRYAALYLVPSSEDSPIKQKAGHGLYGNFRFQGRQTDTKAEI
jgi:hypothetical protein